MTSITIHRLIVELHRRGEPITSLTQDEIVGMATLCCNLEDWQEEQIATSHRDDLARIKDRQRALDEGWRAALEWVAEMASSSTYHRRPHGLD